MLTEFAFCDHFRGGEAALAVQQLQADSLHWFSLLHGMAINLLQVTRPDLDEEDFVEPTLK